MALEPLYPKIDGVDDETVAKVLNHYAFLVIKLRTWSNTMSSNSTNMPANTNEFAFPLRVPVSSNAAAALSKQQDGGAGEGDLLLDEVLAVLGPSASRSEFRRILAGRDAGLIRRCLRRVQDTHSIRVSKAALFRSLLTKLS